MSLFSKRAAISLACAAALGGLMATPSIAGVIAPTDKETVAPESPLEFAGWHRICHYRCHWAWYPRRGCAVASDYVYRPVHRGCVVASDYEYRPVHHYGSCHHRYWYPDYYVTTPIVAYPAYWGWGWGGWFW